MNGGEEQDLDSMDIGVAQLLGKTPYKGIPVPEEDPSEHKHCSDGYRYEGPGMAPLFQCDDCGEYYN